ncbi:hypothetical protein EDM59_21080 [Brevibacillus nitrificans]|uniref:JAB domain-containing protein n=2 Tax=Brevibacillus nitrificans TaxID=651560 RepID=A0A3M8D4N9_9BACL|nr:hypothetical protein EDM59_21080 [Brevibacillus nitrificans]
MVFLLPNEKRFVIRRDPLDKMLQYKQLNRYDKEAGGILIGRILLENGNFIVDDVSEPMKQDIRTRITFKRAPNGHQEYFDQKWAESQGRCFYLGEWHTHPEPVPNPSPVDILGWKRIMSLEHEVETLFFIIIGQRQINVWFGNPINKEIKQIHIKGEISDGKEKS